MGFRTKLDFSNNRQVSQRIETTTILSGATSFGVPFSQLPSGPNLALTSTTNSYSMIFSTFSGNNTTTVFNWGDSRMSIAEASISAITPSNSAITQTVTAFLPIMSTAVINDGYTAYTTYSGVSYNIIVSAMTDLGSGNYSGNVSSSPLFILSAPGLDFTGRTIWNDISGITRTYELIVTKNPQIGKVLTCVDSEGKTEWVSLSATTSGATLWTAGTGINSVVLAGSNSDAGQNSLAIGNSNDAGGQNSLAIGNNTDASGSNSLAIGNNTSVSSDNSLVIGIDNLNSSDAGFVGGSGSSASNFFGFSFGFATQSNGYASHAEGYFTTASGNYSHAEGKTTIAGGTASHAEGTGTTANGNYSHAEGSGSYTVGNYTHAEGQNTTAYNDTSHAEGDSSSAWGYASHAEGWGTTAYNSASHSEGFGSLAYQLASHAEGQGTTASGFSSHAEGFFSTAIGDGSHAEGGYWVLGPGLGNGGVAIGYASHAEGLLTTASGDTSHSEGNQTTAGGTASHAEGQSTTANGPYSHAEGSFTVAFGDSSHAEGLSTSATNFGSHAEGAGSISSGYASHAGGNGSIASGSYSFVHGNSSVAQGTTTIVLGDNITGTSNNTTYVASLNIKTVGSSAFANDIRIDANGNLTTNTSDERLKENIKPITNALNTIKQLNGINYQWVDRKAGGDDIKLGFIAQQVEIVEPKLVFTNKVDGYKGLHVDGIIPLLVEAIKELSSGVTQTNNLYLETQTILAEDNNVELNYNGTPETALGGGLRILHAKGKDLSADLITDNNGDFVTNNDFKPKFLTIPLYTPTSSNDVFGDEGNITRDDNYLYIKTNNGWKRTNLENF